LNLPSGPGGSATERVLVQGRQFISGDNMLLLIIVLLLLFGGGGGYYGYSRWGSRGGLGIVGTVVLIAVILYFLGVLR
jgi:hypothetical protein